MINFIAIVAYSLVITFCWIISTTLTIDGEVTRETAIYRSAHFFLAVICSIGIGYFLK